MPINELPLARARAAYAAYAKTTDNKNFRGDPMPAWEDLPAKIQEAWVNACRAAIAYRDPLAIRRTEGDQLVAGDDDGARRMEVERLRYVAAAVEAQEPVGFSLTFVSEDSPFWSYNVTGATMSDYATTAGLLVATHANLATVLGNVFDRARQDWRRAEVDAIRDADAAP